VHVGRCCAVSDCVCCCASTKPSASIAGDQLEFNPARDARLAPPAALGTMPLEQAEFARLIEQELVFLRKNVRRWHRDKANADDLVQDTVVQALANAHLWQRGSNLRAWLITL